MTCSLGFHYLQSASWQVLCNVFTSAPFLQRVFAVPDIFLVLLCLSGHGGKFSGRITLADTKGNLNSVCTEMRYKVLFWGGCEFSFIGMVRDGDAANVKKKPNRIVANWNLLFYTFKYLCSSASLESVYSQVRLFDPLTDRLYEWEYFMRLQNQYSPQAEAFFYNIPILQNVWIKFWGGKWTNMNVCCHNKAAQSENALSCAALFPQQTYIPVIEGKH